MKREWQPKKKLKIRRSCPNTVNKQIPMKRERQLSHVNAENLPSLSQQTNPDEKETATGVYGRAGVAVHLLVNKQIPMKRERQLIFRNIEKLKLYSKSTNKSR